MKIRRNTNRCEWLGRIAGLWCAVLLILSGCAGSGQAVVIQATEAGTADSVQSMETAAADSAERETAAADGAERGVTAGSSPDSGTAAVPGIIVHICGQVADPGVYELPEGSRVWDAVQAAGGFTGEADPDAVNLAASLADGCKVTIPSRGDDAAEWYEEPSAISGTAQTAGQGDGSGAGEASGTASGQVSGAGSLIDINRASAAELTAIPGIGDVRAAAIVSYRETYGSFHTIEEIMNVSGIKEGLFEKIKDYITAGG